MKVKINKGTAIGSIYAPPSKSMAHRLLICAAMADGKSVVRGISDCEDVSATLDCLASLGVKTEVSGGDVTVTGANMVRSTPSGALLCRESGSTLRFLIPIALLSGKNSLFYGAKGLMQRPMDVYEKMCRERGLAFVSDGESIAVRGPLKSGEFNIAGNISSQFISGLLFALPVLNGDSKIKITTSIESKSYIDLTIEALKIFGIEVFWEDDATIYIKGGQSYTPCDVTVEGDYSGSAFIDALGILGGEVSAEGLNPDSIQGDKVYRRFYEMLKIGMPTIHIGNCPDLGPILLQ